MLIAALGCSTTITAPGDGAANGPGAGGTSSVGGASAKGGSSGTAGKAGGGSSATGGSSGVSGASGSGSGGTEPTDGPRPVSLGGEPIYSRMLRLTNDQWENSVRDILRLAAPTGVSQDFVHAVTGTTDFDNNERVVFVDNASWNDFQLAAETVADQVTATDAALQKVVATTDPATFIRTFGRRAFRRDLTADEVTAYQAIYDQGALVTDGAQTSFTKGAGFVISTMLQSPYFLYRSELGDEGAPLSGFEMAAKLSLWLRDTTPSDAMLDAASSFATPDGAATQATQMLEDANAMAVMRKLHGTLYKFALFDSIAKTGVAGYTEALNAELKEASFLFFDRVFKESLGVRDILTSTVGFAGPAMATLYGLQVSGSGVSQVSLPDRVGYFSQVPFLTLWARNNVPDSIHRGARLNLDTLCADPGFPNQTLPAIPAAEDNQTNRMVITDLTSGCAEVCHGQIINPIGFAFENFDGLGRPRDTDNGQPVDTSGVYPFEEGDLAFAGAPELMQSMAAGAQAHQCWAKKMASYALERDLVEADRPLVQALGAVSQASGSSLKQVMLALAENDAFRTRVKGAP
jgi:hypothetical protein